MPRSIALRHIRYNKVFHTSAIQLRDVVMTIITFMMLLCYQLAVGGRKVAFVVEIFLQAVLEQSSLWWAAVVLLLFPGSKLVAYA